MPRKLLILTLLLISGFPGFTAQFDFNNNCRSAYSAITSLRLKEGQTLLDKEKAVMQANLIPYFLEDYIDFFRIYLSNDKALHNQYAKRSEARLAKIKDGNEQSPWYRYTQAEIHLHQAFIDLSFKEYVSALFGIRKAYKLLEENMELHSTFAPNRKSMAMIKALLGIIPSKYQWGLQFLGMEGNLPQGMQQLKALTTTDYIFRKETVMIYSMLLMHLESKPQEAWKVVKASGMPYVDDLFSYFIAGNIALYSKHTEEAITIFNNRPSGAEFENFPYMDYLTGLGYLNQLDPKAADYLRKFLNTAKGNGFRKSAWHKLAWLALVEGKSADYNTYIQKAATEGTADMDADKQALKEAQSNRKPDIVLLKARLLFDGGYYDKALKTLSERKEQDYINAEQQLEWIYRRARIYDESGQDSLAVIQYRSTIAKGESQPYFYAANAALQLALLYEEKGDKKTARTYFNKCLELNAYEYENSIHQKAKVGLERVR
jgi:hypothetical protein